MSIQATRPSDPAMQFFAGAPEKLSRLLTRVWMKQGARPLMSTHSLPLHRGLKAIRARLAVRRHCGYPDPQSSQSSLQLLYQRRLNDTYGIRERPFNNKHDM
jgi:hypothetical protein